MSAASRRLRQFARHRSALVGTALIAGILFLAAMADVICAHDPTRGGANTLAPPSKTHWLGTDDLGHDNFARLVHGARYSLVIGVGAVTLSALLGALIGASAGYFGGRFDLLVMRGVDILMAFPSILLALLVAAALGRSLGNVIVAVGIVGVPIFTRQMRAAALSVKNEDYVLAARALGAGPWRILARTVLPNCLGPLLVLFTLGTASAVLESAGLNFLGLGVTPETPEWGLMLDQARPLYHRAPWIAVLPGLGIALLVLGFNLLGDGLRDVLDPKAVTR